MRPFDIYSYQPPDWKEGEYPYRAVIVSHRERAGRKDMVEVVICSTQRASRPPSEIEVLLDEADGLDWPTLCRCDLTYAARREDLKQVRGTVCRERQRQIATTILAAHGWAAVL